MPAIILGVAGLVFLRNLLSPNLWFDESGQFLLAIGQYHFAPQGTQYGSLLDSWNYSKGFSLDPGGFTILLRMVIDVFGTQPIVLRALPLVFAFIPIALLFFLARDLQLSVGCSVFASLILFSNQNYLYFASEIRPYSMECCGVIAILLVTSRLLKDFNLKHLIGWVIVSGIFMSSRYSSLIYVVSSCITVISIQLILENKISLGAMIGASLLGVFAFLEYYFMLRYQATGGSPPAYVNDFIIKGKDFSQVLKLLRVNFLGSGESFFGRQVIFKTLFLLSAPIYFYFARRQYHLYGSRYTSVLCIFLFVVLSELLWFALSFAGKMPWRFGTRWALSEIALCSISFLGFSYIAKIFFEIYIGRAYKLLSLILWMALLVSTIYVGRGVINYSRLDYEGENLLATFPTVNQLLGGKGTIVMDEFLYPDYRYLVEYSGVSVPILGGR